MFTPETSTQQWLDAFLREHGGIAGTVHKRTGDNLILVAAHNIPPPVIQITATIPKGKGMAGLAWERREPVQTCNLKTDSSGDVRPGAKAVNAQAAIALPVLGDDGDIRAIVGIAFAHEREIEAAEIKKLAAAAATVV